MGLPGLPLKVPADHKEQHTPPPPPHKALTCPGAGLCPQGVRRNSSTSICCGAEPILCPALSVTVAVRLVWPMATPWTRKEAV